MSICSFPCIASYLPSLCKPLAIFSFAAFVCHYFFFTSFTINASESHAGCFRYHTELSNIKAANTQCRKKIIKYDSFSGKNRLYCETNGLLSSALDKIFHTLNVPPALFCLVQNVDLRHFTSVSCSFHLYHAT